MKIKFVRGELHALEMDLKENMNPTPLSIKSTAATPA